MKNIFFLILSVFFLFSCSKTEEPIVELQTTEGTIQIKLYKETPLHRDNFVKLVKEGFYDGQLFHKVMKDFMMQAGDPNSREASRNRLLGERPSEVTIPSELDSGKGIMKKGALVAVNLPSVLGQPTMTDSYLFYIVQGRKYSSRELDSLELNAYNKALELIFQKLVIANRSRMDYISLKKNDKKKLQELQDSLVGVASKEIEKDKSFLLTKEQRHAFTSIGGLPEMTKNNTVFGEVIKGLDILDKINSQKVDRNARSEKDIRILKASIID